MSIDVLVTGNNWRVYFDKVTKKLVCIFNNEQDEIDFSDSQGMIDYCWTCGGRFIDVRSGCEEDIRADERQELKKASLKV